MSAVGGPIKSYEERQQQQEDNSKKKREIDETTLNFNKIEAPESQRRYEGRFHKNLQVRNTRQDLINMIIPRGIGIKIYGADVHRNRLAEGNLVSVYCNNQNPNELCKREYDDLMNFVNNKLKVIRDNPYELKGVSAGSTKMITEIDNEEKADKAFNLEKGSDGKKIYGQI